MNATDIHPGDRLTWLHTPRGWYWGPRSWPVHVVVVRLGPKRILVEAPLEHGATKRVWVLPGSLRPRAQATEQKHGA